MGLLMLLGQFDIFTLVGSLDFVGTSGGWQWVGVVDGDGGWWWLVMVVAGDGGGCWWWWVLVTIMDMKRALPCE